MFPFFLFFSCYKSTPPTNFYLSLLLRNYLDEKMEMCFDYVFKSTRTPNIIGLYSDYTWISLSFFLCLFNKVLGIYSDYNWTIHGLYFLYYCFVKSNKFSLVFPPFVLPPYIISENVGRVLY